MKITRSNDETARRLRDALHAEADTVQPADAWSTITDRLDRRPSPWAWITQRPVLIGGAVVLIALLGFLAVTQLGGGDDETQVEVVNPPPTEDFSLVAVTQFGTLLELQPDGSMGRVIAEEFAFDPEVHRGMNLGGPTLAVPPSLGAASDPGDVWYLQLQPGQLACESPVGGLDYAPIDGQTYDREPGPVENPVFSVAMSSDGAALAYVTTGPADAAGVEQSCDEGQRALVAVDRHSDETLLELDVPEGSEVEDLAWTPDGQLLVLMLPSSAEESPQPAQIHVLDPAAATDFGEPFETPVWAGGLGEPIAVDDAGDLVVAVGGAEVDSSPFVGLPGQVLDQDQWTDVHVWRGSPEDGTSELVGTITMESFLEPMGGETEEPAGTTPLDDEYRARLTPLSIAVAPDGSTYVTVTIADGWTTQWGSENGRLDTALYRISPDGVTERIGDEISEQLDDGILAVTVRRDHQADPAPGPIDDSAGPVVGARADGSIALLDPATGAVVEELDVTTENGLSLSGARNPEIAVGPDGTIYATSSGASPEQPCADDEFTGDWVTWAFDPDDPGQATLFPTPFSEGDDAPPLPARMATPSPDGTLVAFVTTSSGGLCDGALSVFVSDLRGGGMVVGNHTLPVGVEPTQLVWGEDGQLVISVPVGPAESMLVGVDPLVGGPVPWEGRFVPGPVRFAPISTGGAMVVGVADDGSATIVALEDIMSERAAEPAWTVEIPGETLRDPLTLAQDGTGSIWVTFAEGDPQAQGTNASFSTWRAPMVDGEPGEAGQVSDEFVAVAASPFPPPGESDEPTTATTVVSPTTAAPVATTAPPPAAPAYVYVTSDGAIVRATVGGDSTTVGQLDPTLGNNPILAPHPDGETLYLSLDEGEPCASSMYALDLSNGQLSDVGSGSYPAVSGDGTKLAYVERDPATVEGYCPSRLVVIDLATGTERRWRDPISHGASEGRDPSLRLTNLAWASDNRTLALSAANEGDEELLVDTDQPEGDLVYRDVASGPVPVRDPAVPDAEWWLVGTADLDGNPAVVVRGGCYAQDPCDGADVVRFVPLDGAPTVDTVVPSDGYVFEVGPDGFLFVRGCEESACRGYRLYWLPIAGAEQELVPAEVETAAWLP